MVAERGLASWRVSDFSVLRAHKNVSFLKVFLVFLELLSRFFFFEKKRSYVCFYSFFSFFFYMTIFVSNFVYYEWRT